MESNPGRQDSVCRSSELGVVERVSVEVLEMSLDRLAIVRVATSRDNDGILHDLHGDGAQELPCRSCLLLAAP